MKNIMKPVTVCGVPQYRSDDGRFCAIRKTWIFQNEAFTTDRASYFTHRKVKGFLLIVDGKPAGRFGSLRDAQAEAKAIVQS